MSDNPINIAGRPSRRDSMSPSGRKQQPHTVLRTADQVDSDDLAASEAEQIKAVDCPESILESLTSGEIALLCILLGASTIAAGTECIILVAAAIFIRGFFMHLHRMEMNVIVDSDITDTSYSQPLSPLVS